jgi:hypothetical protein
MYPVVRGGSEALDFGELRMGMYGIGAEMTPSTSEFPAKAGTQRWKISQ